jgi:hypothetical protein
MSASTSDDPLERAVAESREQTAVGLREALRTASKPVLAKLAVDLVPPLFRNEYRGEPGRSGDRWADAIAHPRMTALPSFLVRVHLGAFPLTEVEGLLASMMTVHAPQAALVTIGPPAAPDVRQALGTMVPWLVDLDGLIHLMMSANLGIGTRVYETKYVDASYFR